MAARRPSARRRRRAPAPTPAPANPPPSPAPPPPLSLAHARQRQAALAAEARRQVLTQWRRIDTRAQEIALANRTRAASDIMPGVLRKLGLEQRQTESEVLKVWNHLLDPDIVAHAQPAGLRRGTLFVNVDHSVWLSEIVRYRSKEILARLQHAFGPDLIARISFRLG